MRDKQRQENDYKWFLENYRQLFEEYGITYLVIKDRKVLGSYASYADALHETAKVEPVGSFIVQYCNGNETGYTKYISNLYSLSENGFGNIEDEKSCQIGKDLSIHIKYKSIEDEIQ